MEEQKKSAETMRQELTERAEKAESDVQKVKNEKSDKARSMLTENVRLKKSVDELRQSDKASKEKIAEL